MDCVCMSLGSMGGSMGDAVPRNGVGVVGGFEASKKEEVPREWGTFIGRQRLHLICHLKKEKAFRNLGT